MLETILEALHNLQQAEPNRFRVSKFKIHKRGYRDESRVKKFSSYAGPDEMTRRVLAANARRWQQHPLAFWSDAERHVVIATSPYPPAQLVEVYVKAKCDDA